MECIRLFFAKIINHNYKKKVIINENSEIFWNIIWRFMRFLKNFNLYQFIVFSSALRPQNKTHTHTHIYGTHTWHHQNHFSFLFCKKTTAQTPSRGFTKMDTFENVFLLIRNCDILYNQVKINNVYNQSAALHKSISNMANHHSIPAFSLMMVCLFSINQPIMHEHIELSRSMSQLRPPRIAGAIWLEEPHLWKLGLLQQYLSSSSRTVMTLAGWMRQLSSCLQVKNDGESAQSPGLQPAHDNVEVKRLHSPSRHITTREKLCISIIS